MTPFFASVLDVDESGERVAGRLRIRVADALDDRDRVLVVLAARAQLERRAGRGVRRGDAGQCGLYATERAGVVTADEVGGIEVRVPVDPNRLGLGFFAARQGGLQLTQSERSLEPLEAELATLRAPFA